MVAMFGQTKFYSPRHPIFHFVLLPSILIANTLIFGHVAGPLFVPNYRGTAAGEKYTDDSMDASPTGPSASASNTAKSASASASVSQEVKKSGTWGWLKPGDLNEREKREAGVASKMRGEEVAEGGVNWVNGVPIPSFDLLMRPFGKRGE